MNKINIMSKFLSLLLFASVCMFANSCKSNNNETEVNSPISNNNYIEHIIPQKKIVRINWGTPVKVSHSVYNAEYGRLCFLNSDTVLLVYHCGDINNSWDNIAYRRSFDGGTTWTSEQLVKADNDPNYYGFCNASFLALRNGKILMAYIGRGNPDVNANDNVQLKVSTNRGQSFGASKTLAYGRAWEPAMVEMPNGDIELFYSSEARWWNGIGSTNVEQEILMITSKDGGNTWTSPVSVAYTSGMRDGMPVPVILRENKGIVFTIESINNSNSPYLLWSSIDNSWKEKTQVKRYLATNQIAFGGAPYLAQLPSGETLLSFHADGGRTITDWKKSTMVVFIGDSMAQNFANISYPFPNLPSNEGAFMNSIYIKDINTVVAIGSRNFADGHSEVYWVEGDIVREN